MKHGGTIANAHARLPAIDRNGRTSPDALFILRAGRRRPRASVGVNVIKIVVRDCALDFQ